MSDKLKRQIIKFLVVGVIATIIDYVLLFFCTEILKIPVLLSASISFTISVIYNYKASVNWVFDVNEKNSKKRNFILFIIFSIIGLILTEIIMSIGISFKINYLIIKTIATGIVMIFNFVTRKIFLE